MATRHLIRALLLPKNVPERAVALSMTRGFSFNEPSTVPRITSAWSAGQRISTNSLKSPAYINAYAGPTSFYSTSSNTEDSSVDLLFNDLQALIKSGDIQLIDVREPNELIEYGQYPGAINIPLMGIQTLSLPAISYAEKVGQLKEALSIADEIFVERYKFPKPQPHHQNIVFCAQGPIKSRAAMELAKKLSYNRTRHYKYGWEDYHKNMNLPLKKNPTSG